MLRKTKIIATIGPSSCKESTITKLIKSGVNVFRINLSHGEETTYTQYINTVKQVRERLEQPICIMVDTRGPEVRVKKFEFGKTLLKPNQIFTFTKRNIVGNDKIVSITQPVAVEHCKVGKVILANDGHIKLKIISKTNDDIVCLVQKGGVLSDNKGLCFQGQHLPLEYLNDADKYDLEKTLKLNIDCISASFVNCKEDILTLKEFVNKFDSNVKIIAKIESEKGIENIGEILDECDGVMVARGDLGVEMNFDKLPMLQRKIIDSAKAKAKLSIVATEMLESMIKNNRPTRAEISDVAFAVMEGANAVMLSAETAVGDNPVQCVKTMSQIVSTTENSLDYKKRFEKFFKEPKTCNDLIIQSAVAAGFYLKCKAIVSYTSHGANARKLSTKSSLVPILAITNNIKTYNQLAICSNCIPVYDRQKSNIFTLANKLVVEKNIAKKGDLIIITTGTSDVIDNILKFEIVQ